MTGTQLPPTFPNQPTQRSGLSWLQITGIGCLAVLLLFCVLSYLVVRNFKSMAANMANKVIAQAVDDSTLPPDQKQRIKSRVDGLVRDYKAGKITDQDLGRVMEELAQSSLLPLGAVYAANERYIMPSSLTPEQKAAAVITLRRLAHGVYTKAISQQKLQAVLDLIQTGPPGDREFKQTLTADELAQFLDAAAAAADEAKVVAQPPELNIADEIDRVIDASLNPAAATPPPPADPPVEKDATPTSPTTPATP